MANEELNRHDRVNSDVDRLLAERETRVDDWLPITSDRRGKWWYSAFHHVTAIVGSGVLSLPHAMSCLGWGPGITVLTLSWVITLYTLWQMVQMHEMDEGKRYNRYYQLGQRAFGPKLGLYIVLPPQLLVEVGCCIVYMVTGGRSLESFHDTVCPNCNKIDLIAFIAIFGSVHFFLSQLPSFNSLYVFSLAAAVMSLSYSIVAWAASVEHGRNAGVEYGYEASTEAKKVFQSFSALGLVAFAYAAHVIVLEIQATMPTMPPSNKPSKKPMWKGAVAAFIVVAICYFPVAIAGYYVFGNQVEDIILDSIERLKWLKAMAHMFVVVHVIGSYLIYAMPVFDMIERVYVNWFNVKPSCTFRLIYRSLYVVFTMFVAMVFPFFKHLMAFIGGIAFVPTAYVLPCVMWLALKKPKRFGLSWFVNWICIILGVTFMILSCIGGMWELIVKEEYKFFGKS